MMTMSQTGNASTTYLCVQVSPSVDLDDTDRFVQLELLAAHQLTMGRHARLP